VRASATLLLAAALAACGSSGSGPPAPGAEAGPPAVDASTGTIVTAGDGAPADGRSALPGSDGPPAPPPAPADGPRPSADDAGPPPAPPPLADNDVRFDPPGGTFTAMATVKLAAGVADALIHVTTDGSLPSAASPAYRAPLVVRDTTIVRAFVESASRGTGKVAAAIYVRLADDLAGFSSNLPIVLLHTHKAGMLPLLGQDFVDGSASIFEPGPGGRATLLGPGTLTGRAGVRIRGNSSRAFPQKSYAFEMRAGGSDDDEDRPVVGMPADSDFALVAPSYIDRSLIRTAIGFTLSNEIGQYAPRVRMVEAFVVETGGAAAQKDYLGVFALTEKIKRGKFRVPVEKLDPAAVAPPAVTGGYIFRIDHEANDFTAGGINFGLVYPRPEELMLPGRQTQRAYLQGQLQDLLDALARPDFKNPRTGKGYGESIDVRSFIDYDLLNAFYKNVDAFRFSTYFHKPLGGPIAAGPLWDLDRTMGTPYDDGARTVDPREWARGDAANPLTYSFWGRLLADPAFKTAHARRWAELAAGPLAPAHTAALVDRFAAQVREAQARHVAHWPQMPPMGASYDNELRILKDWLAARTPWMSTQLVAP
jgi:hypothetical protein